MATYPTEWMSESCGGPRYRWTPESAIEVEGEGYPAKPMPAGVAQWSGLIAAAAEKYGLPPNYLAAFVAQESGGKPDVISFDSGYGLMQITSAGLKGGRSDAELLDPETNLDIGAGFLAKLLNTYGGDPIKAAFAYNAGSPRCDTRTSCAPNRWGLYSYCINGKSNDYGGSILAYTNGALAMEFTPSYGVGPWRWWLFGMAAVVGYLAVAEPKVQRWFRELA